MGGKKVSIDQKDREILAELQKNCKQPVRRIAKKLGLRVTTAYDRIRRMENTGIIKGYKALIDAEKVGLPTSAYILFNLSMDGESADEEAAKRVCGFRGVSECHLITGEHDMIAKIRGENIAQIGKSVIDEMKQITGVHRTITMAIVDNLLEDGDVPV